MKIVPLTPLTTRLTLFGLVNCYLVREDDGWTLVDTTLPQGLKTIVQHLQGTGIPLRRIALTHAHVDHAANVDALIALWPEAEVCCGVRETRLYEEAQRGLKPKQFALDASEPQVPVKGSFPANKTNVSHPFSDSEQIGSLQAFFTPGHTPGHMVLVDTRDGTMFAGDAMVSVGGLRVSGDAPWFFPLPNAATWHKPTALGSALRISMLQPARIACGHGTPVEADIKTKMAAALDRAGRAFAHS